VIHLLLLQVRIWLGNLVGHREEGQTLVEYALLIMLIAIVVILAVTTLGTTIKEVLYDLINNEFPST
jgi:pilus assembly protein Flp/PilA